jgi:hypothetical protein
VLRAGTAFLRQRGVAVFGKKMFQRAEQVAAKSSALRLRRTDAAGKQAREKRVRHLTRRIVITSITMKKRDDGRVIRRAQIRQRRLRLRVLAARAEDQRPAGRMKVAVRHRACVSPLGVSNSGS